jgi:DNA repair photolyase
MIRGDGSLGSYSHRREGRTHGDVHRFRLALADTEGLDRARDYLAREGVPTDRSLMAVASSQRRQVHALWTQQRTALQRILEIIAWPEDMSEQWCRGFLAGVFDAEGSWSRVARIAHNDGEILDVTDRCLRRLGLSTVVEPPRPNGRSAVRLTGGLGAVVRFFQLVDPAITRKRSIAGMSVKTRARTRVVEISDLGLELPLYDITTGTGDFIANGVVSHNCFARPTHEYLALSPGADFERKIVVKTNVADVLRAELARPSWRGEKVALGTNTDPYQRCEGRYALMPGIIRALAEGRTPLSILTKGTLINRDRALLADAAREVEVTAAFTVGMLDDETWRVSEPGTPHPRARLDAVRALNDAGVPTGVMLAPIMPGINDDRAQLAALVDRAAAAGATHITPIVLHLRRGVREVFWPWLEHAYPQLVERYVALYRTSQAPRDYRDGVQRFVEQRRREARRRHGQPAHAARPRFGSQSAGSTAENVSRAHAVEQLRLL